jgi:cation diffusion facilitator CzcD-associated flavoprotein CzcO
VTKERVVVAGAGAAGLSVAAMLKRRGVESLVLERTGRVASSWRSRYDSLRLNTPRLTSTLAGYRMPRRYGRWPVRDHGELIHAAAYRNPEPFRGKDVLVVSARNTGSEISHELARRAPAASGPRCARRQVSCRVQPRQARHPPRSRRRANRNEEVARLRIARAIADRLAS